MPPAAFHLWDAAAPDDFTAWERQWQAWPQHCIFAHPAYVRLFARAEIDRALAAVWQADGATILYPFLLRDLRAEKCWKPDFGPVFDLTTPYGYGGPFRWTDTDAAEPDATAFWRAFDAWAAAQPIVTEFVRRYLFDDQLIPHPGHCRSRTTNVVCRLDVSPDERWNRYAHKVRKNVRTARRAGIEIIWDRDGQWLDDFLNIYGHTLNRRDAIERYYFPRSFFDQLHRDLAGRFVYAHALHDGQVVSSELVLHSADAAYSFLGGTLASSFPLRPNELLKHRLMDELAKQGMRSFVLGGGLEPGDGIERYKRAFAPHGLMPFYTCRRVLLPELYAALTDRRQTQITADGEPRPAVPDFFPGYRA